MCWAAALFVLLLRRRSAGKEGWVGGVPATRRLRGPRPGHRSSSVMESASLLLGLEWGMRCSAPEYRRTRGCGLRACRGPRSRLSRSTLRLQGGLAPRVASAGHPSSPTSTQAPAIFRGRLVRLQRRRPRRVVRHLTELGS
ncbi:hypothetical protein NDU88_003267 [Pleurodeles waltl]|uniref:Secreted protein n=1 Tax=Pleurodeles waltl TaxID=8319 RepID=A0AAV7RGB4_PLEWA|nr:hypothetical protein NDU88_003267 [Pleurodeles waltl]